MIRRKNIWRSNKTLNPGILSKSKNKNFKRFWKSSDKKLLVSKTTKSTLGTTWRRSKLRKLGDFLGNYLNQAAQPSPTCGTRSLLPQVAEAALGPHNPPPAPPLLLGTSTVLGHSPMMARRIRQEPLPIGAVTHDAFIFQHLFCK